MKLSTLFAKLTGSRVTMLGAVGGLALMGTAMVAAPTAGAQVAFGIAVGGPRYYAPAPAYVAPGYGGYGYSAPAYGAYDYGYDRHAYWEQRRAEELREFREREWREREAWEHRGHGYDRDWRMEGRDGGWR